MGANREKVEGWGWQQYICIAFFVFSFIALAVEQLYLLSLKYPSSNLYSILDFGNVMGEVVVTSILYCPALSLFNMLLNVKKYKNNYIKFISALLAAALIIFLYVYMQKY